MKIAILLGSIRLGRQSHKIAYYLKEQLEERQIEVDLIDLAENHLPILEERAGNPLQNEASVKNISNRLNEAHAIVFVTPEYHGSFSGVLKNAIDYFWSEFNKKPIGVVAVSSGRLGGINASSQLQHVVLSLGAFPLPTKLLVSEVHQSLNDSFKPINESLVRSTKRFIDEYLWFAEAIVRAKVTVAS